MLESEIISVSKIPAVVPACSPSCGPNALCQEEGELPVCVCDVGFQGDGYKCTGKC